MCAVHAVVRSHQCHSVEVSSSAHAALLIVLHSCFSCAVITIIVTGFSFQHMCYVFVANNIQAVTLFHE